MKTMCEVFLHPSKYISDSRVRWREGDPLQDVDPDRHPRLHILVHPENWSHTIGDIKDRVHYFEKCLTAANRRYINEEFLADVPKSSFWSSGGSQ